MRILIIRPGALGDTLLMLPAIKAAAPFDEIILAGRTPGICFLRPYVAEVRDFEGAGWHRLFMPAVRPGKALPVDACERVVAFLRDADGRVGANLRAFFPGADVRFFPSLPSSDERMHVAEHVAQCLAAAGLSLRPSAVREAAGVEPVVGLPPRTGGIRHILLHPGSGNPAKNHAPAFWLRLATAFRTASCLTGVPVHFLLGPAEEGLRVHLAARLGDKTTRVVTAAGPEELLALLAGSALYVGHDSGVTHLAAMAGVPTVALFRRDEAERWAPLGPRVAVLQNADGTAELVTAILAQAARLHSGMTPRGGGSGSGFASLRGLAPCPGGGGARISDH